jgi:Sel1 repeat
MNWTYIGTAAILPLMVALGLTMAVGVIQALRLTHLGVPSRPAFIRMLRAMALAFPITFLSASLWDGRHTWRGLLGVALHRPVDLRTMGQLRAGGGLFFLRDDAKATQWYRQAAEGGDAQAQLLLAQALRKGQGLPRDPEEALRWARAAADKGYPDAMVLCGDLLSPSNSEAANNMYHQALATYRERARKGDSQACLSRGQMHRTGKGTPPDPVEALAWMLLARQFGLSSLQDLIIQLTERKLTQPQRAEALQRALAIRKELSQPGQNLPT